MNGRDLLDPEIAAMLAALPEIVVSSESLATLRAFGLTGAYEASGAVEQTDYLAPGPPDVPVRVHRPLAEAGSLPCIYSIHGGGYVLGDYHSDDARFESWCVKHRCIGVSVDYRLAPETPYPGPLEDCYAGLAWVHDHADELGIDGDRIGVMGVSAGGGLAAALALLVRDRGELALAFQLLECPMLDDRQRTVSSQLDDLQIWNRASNAFGWRSYLGPLAGTDDVPAYAAPARATDLRGLPPTLISVGGADGFRDEDIDYALRLGQAGVPTELHVYPGAPHGVTLFATTDLARRWNRHENEWLRAQLAPATTPAAGPAAAPASAPERPPPAETAVAPPGA